MRDPLCRSAIALFITGSLAVSGASIAQQEQEPTFQSTQEAAEAANRLPAGQIPAVLKSREVDFIYRSTRTPLACDQLRNRVATVLRAVGARDDIQVDARECDSFLSPDPRSRPSQSGSRVQGTFEPRAGGDLTNPMMDRTTDRMRMTRADRYDRDRSQTTPVHIRLMMPVVITPEVVQEVERDKSRRALVSRVQGNQNAVLDDPIYFPAERRDVTLSHDSLELEPMDCELLEQMQRTVFRELDLKVTSSALSCDSESYLKPRLTVNALLPVGLEMPGERKLRERAEKKAAKSKDQETSQ
ncbi:MAG TPA: hypothetical protein VJS12_12470 [Steroidobacteraceae bacterium]|nr:hypothetical protein [Steroidobacteraceae bacterium]